MPVKQRPDYLVIACAMVLLGFGVVMIFSSSAIIAVEKYNDAYYFLKRQMMWASLGVIAMLLMMRLDYRMLRKYYYVIYIGVVLFLLLVFIPGVGVNVNGAHRWINLGLATVQPSEFAKLGLIIFFAAFLARKEAEGKLGDFIFGFAPSVAALLLVFVLIQLQPDLGTAVIVGLVAFSLFAVAGVRLAYLGGAILFAMPFLWAAVYNVGYRRRRLLSFLNPWDDLNDSGYQIIQSFVALARGGVWGSGLGNGRQKLFYLPEPHTDFIFSIIGEEMGLIGGLAVMAVFAVLAWRGIRIGLRTQDKFGSLLALGITFAITMQALFNVSVTIGLLPTKGLPLPFISLGGSALVMWMMSVGLLANISENGPGAAAGET
ncbi:MAG: putative lipid II flippase FtsW [Nitrospinae bacterium]|nr:putative lipid II flippase FtsW [Nitrospinota bacterium]